MALSLPASIPLHGLLHLEVGQLFLKGKHNRFDECSLATYVAVHKVEGFVHRSVALS